MRHYTDDEIDRALEGVDLEGPLREAFVALARGEAAQQPRIRTEAGGVKLSTLGAVVPALGVVGAKVYTTIAGRFSFVVVLFSATTGEPLATFQANALTRRRTAAVSLLAARALGARTSRIVVLGTGVQGQAHAAAFGHAFPGATVSLLGRAEAAAIPGAVRSADVIVTATRSAAPLFDGRLPRAGAVVCAVGSSRPDTRELDDALLARARRVVVEARGQALAEAGDLVLAAPAVREGLAVVELGELLAGVVTAPAGEVALFKSVGVGLEDVVAAALAFGRLAGENPRG